jgi:hypothetical protein
MRNALVPQAARRVGRLRIRAAQEGDARHISIALSDALRTATIPGADEERMVVVRKLALGRVSRWASPMTLALHIETAMRKARLSAVPFALPAATEANAVIFPGRAEAILTLARRLTRGLEPNEWFWRAIVAGWNAPYSRGERWVALIDAAHGLPQSAAISAKILAEAIAAGVEDELLRALEPGQGAAWLQLEGWNFNEDRSVEPAAPEPQLRSWTPRHREVIDRCERHWGERSDRLAWVATVLAVDEHPSSAANPKLLAATRQRLGLARIHGGLEKRGTRPRPFRGRETDLSPPPNDTVPGRAPATEIDESGVERKWGPAQLAANEPGEVAPLLDLTTEMELSPEFSGYAGLLFVVPILTRLGFTEFVNAHPDLLECEFPARLLRFIGARVGLPRDDPLARALDSSPSFEPAFRDRELPEPVRDILAFPAPRGRVDSLCLTWLTLVRRWSRRRARLGLISLICRPGRVAISQTHIDLSFDLAAADVRLRRVALDVDPGWVPWLGRVVRFHYLDDYDSSD